MEVSITQDELEAVLASDLPKQPVPVIAFVTQTQFSIARYYGGCTFNGQHYTYGPTQDVLIRDDVVKFLKKLRKPKRTKA